MHAYAYLFTNVSYVYISHGMLCINIGLWVAVTFMFTDGHVGKIEDLAPSRPLTKNPGLLTGFPPKKSERTSNTTIHSSLDVMQLMCHELKDLI